MTAPKIVTYPDPILREVMPYVDTLVDVELLLRETNDMFGALVSTDDGAAIAANQVGIRKHMFVISLPVVQKYALPDAVIINPRVVRSGKLTSTEEEGCLSFPGRREMVCRPKKVDVEYDLVNSFEKVRLTLTGFASRMFQHEIDHLNGVLFIDEHK